MLKLFSMPLTKFLLARFVSFELACSSNRVSAACRADSSAFFVASADTEDPLLLLVEAGGADAMVKSIQR